MEADAYEASVSEEILGEGLCLPSGTALKDSDLERICGVIRGLCK